MTRALALLGLLAACASPPATRPATQPASAPAAAAPAPAAEAIAFLGPFADRVCARPDRACLDQVRGEASASLAKYRQIAPASDDEAAKLDALAARLKGCIAATSPPAAPTAAEAIAYLEPLVEKACACADKACVKALMATAEPTLRDKYGDVMATAEEEARMGELMNKLTRCVVQKTRASQ